MTNRRTLAAAGVTVLALAAGGLTASQFSSSTTTVSTFPPAPQNLRAYEVGPDHVKVTYGPSIVGPFTIEPAPNGRSATIRWGGSRDDLYPLGVTYDFYKNGSKLWGGRTQTYAVVGFTLSVRSFTTCVVPHSQNGFGPKRCTTWTGVK